MEGFKGFGFAVFDGAFYEDLPAILRRHRVFARSLFLEYGDPEMEKAGPWLVSLGQSTDTVDKTITLAEEKCPVFWRCSAGEAALHRHLRSINVARIPTWAARGSIKPELIKPQTNTVVSFRHYDANVLGALMPCLDVGQFSRVLGPAEEIIFMSSEFGGLKTISREVEWGAAPPGMLTISEPQILALIDRRAAASKKRIATYLRDHAPDQTRELSDAQLVTSVDSYDRQARSFGVCDEDAIGLWSYMQVTSRVDLHRDEFVVRYIADPAHGFTPGQRVKSLFDLRTRILEDAAKKAF